MPGEKRSKERMKEEEEKKCWTFWTLRKLLSSAIFHFSRSLLFISVLRNTKRRISFMLDFPRVCHCYRCFLTLPHCCSVCDCVCISSKSVSHWCLYIYFMYICVCFGYFMISVTFIFQKMIKKTTKFTLDAILLFESFVSTIWCLMFLYETGLIFLSRIRQTLIKHCQKNVNIISK